LKEAAEEIVSDVFFEVWKMRDDLEKIQNIKSWMLVATYRKSISYLRKESDKTHHIISFDEIDHFHFEPVQSPDQEIISREEVERINTAIEKLPPKCKHVFFLAKIERLPYIEIADMLGISVKTINNHVASALKEIAKALNLLTKKRES
jgi:RNA polymerase sigma-70 factor (ECF subfamily)